MFKRNSSILKLSTLLLALTPILATNRTSGTMVGEPKLPAKLVNRK